MTTKPHWSVAAIAFLCTLLAMACFDHVRDWNTATRFLLSHAIVDHGTVEITRYVTADGRLRDDPPTRDLAATPDERYYCDKPPGQSLMGAAAYGILRTVFGFAPAMDVAGKAEPSDYWVTLGTSGLALAATAALLIRFLGRLGVGPFAATATAVAYAWTTYAAVYGTLNYSHAWAALLVLGSLVALPIPEPNGRGGKEEKGSEGTRGWWASGLAGLLAGAAVAFEYTTAVFAGVVVSVWLVGMLGQPRARIGPFAAFVCGMLPAIAALAWYHWRITGDPFRPSYTLEVNPEFAYHRQRVVPISLASEEAVWGLLLSPYRGLVWNAPMVLGSIPGLVLLWMRRRKRLATIISLTYLGLFFAIGGFPSWHGGWATGPRLLLAGLPLLAIPVGVWLGWRPSSPGCRRVDLVMKFVWVLACIVSFVRITLLNVMGGRFPFEGPGSNPIGDPLSVTEPHCGQWIADGFGGASPFLGFLLTLGVLGFLGALPIAAALWRPPIDPRGEVTRRAVRTGRVLP